MPIKRVKTPIVLQMEATECGAAALGIILGYYARFVPLEQLRIECGVSRDGSNALNMVKVARQYGFIAQGVQLEIEDLHELKFPFIAFWEFNHFVVVEGATATKIYINDPATGPRIITQQDFDRSFTGVALVFEPGKKFTPGGKKISPFRSLLPRLKTIPDAFAIVILFSILLVVPGVLIPAFSKIFIDNILIQQINHWLIPLLWSFFLVGVLRGLLGYLQQFYLTRLQLKMIVVISAKFVWHILHLPFNFFAQRYAGDIQARISANDRIANWLTGDLSLSIVNLFAMVFFAIIMLLYDWVLSLISILAALINASMLIIVNRQLQNNSSRLQQEIGKLNAVAMFGLEAIETLKATSSEDAFFQRWAGFHAQTINSEQRIQLSLRKLMIWPSLINGLLVVAILGVGGFRIMDGYLTIGGLIAFQFLTMSFNEPLWSLISQGSKLQQLRGDLLRLEDVNRYPEDLRFTNKKAIGPINQPNPSENTGTLKLENVTFGYSPIHPPLLEHVDITVAPGQKIAIVGISGSGKSTLAKLICGLYSPWSGNILWNQQPIADIPLEIFSKAVGFVDQDIFLFEGSIYDNITLWNPSIPEKAIQKAISDAGLQDLLGSRGHGIYSRVLAGGGNFSGGQRQQLEIARALATDPGILVLDEATASLDAATEQTIMQNLKQRGCSLLVVAHRLSTIRNADEIIVLHQGKIMERGSMIQLLEKKEHFYNLMQG